MASRDAMPATNLPDVVCYEDLLDSGDPDFVWPILDERTACLLCFTSGTTGDPKGALYSHRGTVLNAMSSGAGNGWGLSADDAILAIPGFFHCNGWAVPFFGPMFGAKIVMPGRRADTEWLHRLIVEENITVGPGVPTIWLSMLDHCRDRGLSLGRLNRIFSGGTAPPAAMIEAYLRDFGVRTIHGWGMTETTSGATMSFAASDLSVMRTPGKSLFGNEIRIASDDDQPLPRDGKTPGHLQTRGAWVAGAYFRRPDADAITADGWLRTGDIATIDPDGTLHIVDRAKDVIKSGGEWISSQALEGCGLSFHPRGRLSRPPSFQSHILGGAGAPVPDRGFTRNRVGRGFARTSGRPGAEMVVAGLTIAFVEELPHGPTRKTGEERAARTGSGKEN